MFIFQTTAPTGIEYSVTREQLFAMDNRQLSYLAVSLPVGRENRTANQSIFIDTWRAANEWQDSAIFDDRAEPTEEEHRQWLLDQLATNKEFV